MSFRVIIGHPFGLLGLCGRGVWIVGTAVISDNEFSGSTSGVGGNGGIADGPCTHNGIKFFPVIPDLNKGSCKITRYVCDVIIQEA